MTFPLVESQTPTPHGGEVAAPGMVASMGGCDSTSGPGDRRHTPARSNLAVIRMSRGECEAILDAFSQSPPRTPSPGKHATGSNKKDGSA